MVPDPLTVPKELVFCLEPSPKDGALFVAMLEHLGKEVNIAFQRFSILQQSVWSSQALLAFHFASFYNLVQKGTVLIIFNENPMEMIAIRFAGGILAFI